MPKWLSVYPDRHITLALCDTVRFKKQGGLADSAASINELMP